MAMSMMIMCIFVMERNGNVFMEMKPFPMENWLMNEIAKFIGPFKLAIKLGWLKI